MKPKGKIMTETVVALYDNVDRAQQTVRQLVAARIAPEDISLLTSDPDGRFATYLTQGDDVSGDEGASFGAVVGGLTGLMAGLTSIVIPGIGPIIAAGPLAALLGGATGAAVGAATGAVTGGIIASLIDAGVPDEHAQYYAEALRRGNALVAVNTEGDMVIDAMHILRENHPISAERRATVWRQAGWTGFDPKAGHLTGDDLAKERTMYSDEARTEDDPLVHRYPQLPPR
jgi:uncharacterized membrane protein